MRLSDYMLQMNDLQSKLRDLTTVSQSSFGYAKTVLTNATNDLQSQLDSLNNLALMPAPTTVRIWQDLVGGMDIMVGTSRRLNVKADMSDGTSRDITHAARQVATFMNSDDISNVGLLTSADASGYKSTDCVFRLTRASGEWLVVDCAGTSGLQVLVEGTQFTTPAMITPQTPPNTYMIADIHGNSLGVVFTTDGKEVDGDNWRITVRVESTGTTYFSDTPSVATVSGDGLVTAVAAGNATITVTNGTFSTTVSVRVA